MSSATASTPGFTKGDSQNLVVNSSAQKRTFTEQVISGDQLQLIASSALGGVQIPNQNVLSRSPGRYYLEEFFKQLPALNAVLAAYISPQVNSDFEVLGLNATSDDVTFSATTGAIQLQTDGGALDSVIVLPHLDAGQTSWTSVLWGTENQVDWECTLMTPDITNIIIWAGLKLTNVDTIATDADQVYLRFSTTDADTTWHSISSIGGIDTNTASTIALVVNTVYRLRVTIDVNRLARLFVNETLVFTTAALTNDVSLIPFVGVLGVGANVATLNLSSEKISRIVFE